jgi:hypothetical protein
MLEKTKGAIKNGQSRHWQHWAHKTQNEDKLKTNHRPRVLDASLIHI